MILSDAQYLEFVDAQLKLPKGKRAEYLGQVDTLIGRLSKIAGTVPGLSIRKFLKTGSLRKGTVLKPKYGRGVDADVAVFVELALGDYALDRLHELLKSMLVKAYPTKSASDFTIQPRTLGIEFIDSGLDVDLVPVIPIDGPGDYGWQPSSQGKALLKTSISGQLAFIQSYKSAYANWSALVRLLKRWRDHHEVSELRSFTIELIVCYLSLKYGTPKSINDGLSRFFLFVASDLGVQRVAFPVAAGGKGDKVSGAGVVVVDPVNPENNVASRIGSFELAEIQQAAETAWELHNEAQTWPTKGSTLENLRAIFGNDFDYESAVA